MNSVSEMGLGLANFAVFAKIANWLRILLRLRSGCENSCFAVPSASHPVFNCISFSLLCLGFSIDFWAC